MRLTPQEMAEIYYSRMRFMAVRAVTDILDEYKRDVKTSKYWHDVLAILRFKIENHNRGRVH